jgi:phage-related minor tail protein
MSETTNTATIRVVADATGVEAGLRQATDAARQTGRAVSEVGSSASVSARNVEAAQRNIVQAIQRTTIAMEAGGKSTAAYYELLASQRGVDPAALAPYIAQLRAVEQAQASVTQAAAAQQAEQLRVAESARVQAAAQRELAQAQATRDNFLSGLREQVSLFGASTEEVLRYRAAQAGAADAAEPLIAQLREMRAAQELANEAARENAEAARAQTAAQRELAQAQASRDAFVAGLREQIQLFGRSTEEVLRYRAAEAGASQEAAHLILQLQNMRAAQEQVAQAARDQAEAQRLAAREQAGRDTFIDSLQQQVAAIGRTRAELLELRAAELGVSNQAAPFIARLREAEGGLARTGASAAQTAAALRMVPAQVTDIVTSLQGGQAPLTVFLQQGGQLRDMFGSSGAAARALGGYVMSLITPFSIGTAAAVALAVAYHQGSEEARKYQAALITSGNAAGTSADKLALMAQHISSSVGTQGAAAEALAALVATGKVAADSLDNFGAVAVRGQRALGQSVADTAGEFAELAKSPVAALEKLNDQYHFLNGSVYEQVRALQEQGRNYEAAQVAQQAYAVAFDGVTTKVEKNLGIMQKGWRGVSDFAKSAWDAMLDVGREDTLEQKLAKVRKSIENASKPFDAAVGGNAEDRAKLQSNKELEASLERQIATRDREAMLQAGQARLNAADLEWSKVKLSNLSRQQQLQNELETVRNKGLEAGASDKAIDDELLKVRQKYADLYNAGIDSNIAAMKRRDQVADVLEQRELARIQAQRAAGGMTEDGAINATAVAELAAFNRKRALLEAELAQTKLKANSIKEQSDLEGQISVLDEQRKSRAIQLTQDLFAAEQKRYRQAVDNAANLIEAQQASLRSEEQLTQAQLDSSDAIGLSQRQIAALTASRLLDIAAQKEEKAVVAEGWDLTGERAESIRKEAAAIRERATAVIDGAAKQERYDQWKQAIDQYGQVFQQGFADMLNNGRDGWSSFTHSLVTTFKTSVADQIYKMFARPIIVQLVGSYLGVSQTAIAGEIASQPNAYGVTAGGGSGVGSAISAAQTASSIYKAISGGFSTLSTGVADAVQAGLYQSGLSTQIASNGAFATSAGSVVSGGTGALAGHYIGNAIAGDYSVAHGQTVTNIASVVGAIIGGPIGGAIGGAIGGLINRAFGMGSTEVQSQGMRGTLSAAALTGKDYQELHQDGGWLRSDKDWTKETDFTAEMVKQFTQGLSAIETASSGFASSLGVQADWIKDYSKVFDLKLTGDATKDQQVITDFFTGIGDEIANKLVPNLDELSKSGETASAALERLAGDFKGTDQIAQLLGFSAGSLFGSAGLESAKAREQLIDLAGGLSVLSSQAAFFNQNFLSDAERIKPVAEALDKALASLGLSTIPATRDEFKALVSSLITSGAAASESGAKQLDSLLALGEAFAQVHPAADAAAEAVDKAAAAMQAVKDAAAVMFAGVNDSYSVLQKVVSREKSAIQVSVDSHTAAFNKLQSLSQALHSTLDSLKSPDQKAFERAGAQAQIRAALAIAKAGGPLPDSDSLKAALSAVTQDASSQFSSYADYMRDLLQTQNDVAQLAGLTDDSLSVEQRSLDALKDQLARLDDIVANGQAQLDALNGQSIATLSLAQALAAFQGSLTSAQTNPVVAGTSSIASFYQELLGRAPDQAGLQYWQDALARGNGLDAIRSGFMDSDEYKHLHGVPGFATGGMFGGGLRLVGENGPELEATGPSRIWSSNQTAALLARAGSGDSAAVVAELKAVKEELRAFREANSAENRGIAKGTQETAGHLDAAINGDKPLATKVITSEVTA